MSSAWRDESLWRLLGEKSFWRLLGKTRFIGPVYGNFIFPGVEASALAESHEKSKDLVDAHVMGNSLFENRRRLETWCIDLEVFPSSRIGTCRVSLLR